MIVNAADSAKQKLLGDGTCRTDRIDRREAEAGINRANMVFGCPPCRCTSDRTTRETSWESLKGFDIPTLAFALIYAVVQAGAKSGTSAGLSTGGGCFGELSGYTPGMGGSEDGDGKGAKGYGVTGMIDGPDSVITLILVVVTEEDGGGLLLPEEDKLAELDVDVTEEENDCDELVDGGRDKGVGGDDNDDGGKKNEGTTDARTAAARKTRMAKALMGVQPCGLVGENRKRVRRQRGELPEARTLIGTGRLPIQHRRCGEVLKCITEQRGGVESQWKYDETRWNATW
jgi:hypothetical protein